MKNDVFVGVFGGSKHCHTAVRNGAASDRYGDADASASANTTALMDLSARSGVDPARDLQI